MNHISKQFAIGISCILIAFMMAIDWIASSTSTYTLLQYIGGDVTFFVGCWLFVIGVTLTIEN
jgi:hypothetical protein